MTAAINKQLANERTALTSAGVLRTTRPTNVRTSSGVDLVHEDPLLLSAFYNLAAAHPRDVFTITSGARTFAQQVAAFRRYQDGSGGIAASPGTSNHEPSATGTGYAEAIDALVNGHPIETELGDNALALFGLHATVPADPVHVTLQAVNG